VVPSLDAHARLEAALHSLDLAGSTKCSTAPNVRPTVLDYHFTYENSELLCVLLFQMITTGAAALWHAVAVKVKSAEQQL